MTIGNVLCGALRPRRAGTYFARGTPGGTQLPSRTGLIGTLHQDINVGDQPIEVMVVELENEK